MAKTSEKFGIATEDITAERLEQEFFFPEYGRTIRAKSQEEALKILEARKETL
jgi:hypothetical protein